VRKRFTSCERDEETRLDFAQARYLNSGLGRFSSPDYFGNDTHGAEPQSWNLYEYARNNPLRYVDPSGKEVWVTFKGGDDKSVVKLRLEICIDEDGNETARLYDEDGNEYVGNSTEVADGLNVLNEVLASEAGASLRDLAGNSAYFGLSLVRDDGSDPSVMPGLTFAGSDGRNTAYTWAGVSYNSDMMKESVQALSERILMAAEIQRNGVNPDTNSDQYLAERDSIRKEIYEGTPRMKPYDPTAPPPPPNILRKTLTGSRSAPYPPCNEPGPPPPRITPGL
jgi:RHS repeat-associated protein